MDDRGPTDRYEITWKSGHVDRLDAHQVSWPGGRDIFTGITSPERVRFHAEINGQWTLLLDALQEDIATIRNATHVDEGLGL